MSQTAVTDETRCDAGRAATRSLLGYGLLAGPLYLGVSLAQALTRPGFDLTRHAWSLLANGPLGWVQVANLVLSGLAVAAFAAGVRRACPDAPLAARLLGVFGLSLVTAGVFRADPAQGFPAGTPEGPGAVTWHGVVHLAAGGIGFTAVAAAALLLAARFAAQGRRGWAWWSRATGGLFLASFAGVASGVQSPWTTLGFVAGVILLFGWLTALAARLYRSH